MLTKTKPVEFKVTESQQHVINLITTWKPNNVKLAIQLDNSQELGVEELYRSFLKELNIWGDFEEKYDSFPIESCLFERTFASDWIDIRRIKKIEALIYFIKKFVLLFGKCVHFTIQEATLSTEICALDLVKEVNEYYNQDDFLCIVDVPF